MELTAEEVNPVLIAPRLSNFYSILQNHRQFAIIIKVLKSKRLLSDHIEILEDFLNLHKIHESKDTGRLLKVSATTIGTQSVAGAATALVFRCSGGLSKYGLGLAAVGLGLAAVFAGRQWKGIYHDYQDMRRLSTLLDNLGRYHSLIKRNLTYLTDLSHLNGITKRDLLLGSASVDSLLRVIKSMHNFVTYMDDRFPAREEWLNYQPFEDLGDCVSLSGQDSALKNLKSVYMIFLYIQSQFVLRTAIALIELKPEVTEKDLEEITKALAIEVVLPDLRIIRKAESRDNTIKCSTLMDKRASSTDGLGKLKWTTMNLSTKLLVQSNQFERINERLTTMETTDRKKLLALNEDLSNMESLFVATACDFEYLQILLKKILNIDIDRKDEAIKNDRQIEDSPAIAVDQSTAINIDDEFFILDGQMLNDKEAGGANDGSQMDDGRNERVLKSSFKPVLKQLRKQIDPLNEEMIERERKFLQGQGVDVASVDIVKPSPGMYSSSTESEDELDDDMILRKKKFTPKPSKYDENRQFLEEKLNSGFFRMPPPMRSAAASEDILE